MQEVTTSNEDVIYTVFTNAIKTLDSHFARIRLSKTLENIHAESGRMSSDFDFHTFVDLSYEVNNLAERYTFDLITEREFERALLDLLRTYEQEIDKKAERLRDNTDCPNLASLRL